MGENKANPRENKRHEGYLMTKEVKLIAIAIKRHELNETRFLEPI